MNASLLHEFNYSRKQAIFSSKIQGDDMSNKIKLTRNIKEHEFDNGYWYAHELKLFAKEIGVHDTTRLRKDELEKLIKDFIRTGKVRAAKPKKLHSKGTKDHELGLTLRLPIKNFVDNKETKEFIKKEALKINPDLKKKSGAQYRLNRWREQQLKNGKKITYQDLIRQYIKLNETKSFKRIPHGRYINFMADYLANEKDASRIDAIRAWKRLKKLDVPKDYKSWKTLRFAK